MRYTKAMRTAHKIILRALPLAAVGLALAGRTVTSTTRIPFGPCIALAFWLIWLHGGPTDDMNTLFGRP